ncbi:MAG: CDP-glycerol glycerophosphotransferase family protein [Clostridia bacterium]|nr:CDP-glycerol glycerophosphotransferase family protein [Clostridia bacterium]
MARGLFSKFGYALDFLVSKASGVRKNRIVFTSFDGHYSDSPKYISEKIHELSPDTEIVWLVSERYASLVPDYAKCVDINSREARKYVRTARALVDNVYWRKVYVRKSNSPLSRIAAKIFGVLAYRKRQICFTTWHGTPLKRMGRDQIGDTTVGFTAPNAVMLLGNKFTLDIMRRLTFDAMDMRLIGCPRNDILFSDEEQRRAVKARLGLPLDKRVVLYAPTFRTDSADLENKNVLRSGVNQVNDIDFDALFSALSERFGADFVFVCRFHYHVEKMVDFAALSEKYPGKIINGNLHDDMAEYLAATDVLITDASSCMFDFALTGRPTFLLFPDIDYYQSTERGFYLDPASLPFPLSKSARDMISDILEFNNEDYKTKTDAMLSELGYVDDKNSSERVARFILERCNTK